jgi:hypothetical protein
MKTFLEKLKTAKGEARKKLVVRAKHRARKFAKKHEKLFFAFLLAKKMGRTKELDHDIPENVKYAWGRYGMRLMGHAMVVAFEKYRRELEEKIKRRGGKVIKHDEIR